MGITRSPMLQASNITKMFGMRPILRDVSLQVAAGEYVAILGPNGAGKTTLLKVVATLIRPDRGDVMIDGIDASKHPEQVRVKIGVVSHQPLVYPDLSAAENLLFYARMYGVSVDARLDSARIEMPVADALRHVDLYRRAHDPVRTFSRGMLQRLSIARALIHNPPMLLLDEPYTGLDQASARTLSSLLRDLAVVGRTVLMTTHEYHRGLDGVTRAIIIKSGKISHEMSGELNADRLDELVS